MRALRSRPALPVLAVALFVSACAGPRAVTSETPAPAATAVSGGTATAPAGAGSDDLERLYWERQREARSRFTKADVDFMTGMIAHHAQALVMCRLAPTNGASPSVATLCSRILNAQQDEITTMQNWLRDRGQEVPEVHIDGLHLMIHGVADHHMHMPGMLTQEQLDELGAAKGPDFDRMFLRYMIQHHSGAVGMVDDLFATDGAGQDEAAFKLASDIHVDQVTEIERMRQMLERLSGGSNGR